MLINDVDDVCDVDKTDLIWSWCRSCRWCMRCRWCRWCKGCRRCYVDVKSCIWQQLFGKKTFVVPLENKICFFWHVWCLKHCGDITTIHLRGLVSAGSAQSCQRFCDGDLSTNPSDQTCNTVPWREMGAFHKRGIPSRWLVYNDYLMETSHHLRAPQYPWLGNPFQIPKLNGGFSGQIIKVNRKSSSKPHL